MVGAAYWLCNVTTLRLIESAINFMRPYVNGSIVQFEFRNSQNLPTDAAARDLNATWVNSTAYNWLIEADAIFPSVYEWTITHPEISRQGGASYDLWIYGTKRVFFDANPLFSMELEGVTTAGPTTSTAAPTTSTVRPTTSSAAPTTSTVRATTSSAAPTTSTVRPTTSSAAPTTSAAGPTASSAGTTTGIITSSVSLFEPTTSAPDETSTPPASSTRVRVVFTFGFEASTILGNTSLQLAIQRSVAIAAGLGQDAFWRVQLTIQAPSQRRLLQAGNNSSAVIEASIGMPDASSAQAAAALITGESLTSALASFGLPGAIIVDGPIVITTQSDGESGKGGPGVRTGTDHSLAVGLTVAIGLMLGAFLVFMVFVYFYKPAGMTNLGNTQKTVVIPVPITPPIIESSDDEEAVSVQVGFVGENSPLIQAVRRPRRQPTPDPPE